MYELWHPRHKDIHSKKTSTQKIPDFISRLKSIIYNYNPIVVSKLNTAGIGHLFIFNFCTLWYPGLSQCAKVTKSIEVSTFALMIDFLPTLWYLPVVIGYLGLSLALGSQLLPMSIKPAFGNPTDRTSSMWQLGEQKL